MKKIIALIFIILLTAILFLVFKTEIDIPITELPNKEKSIKKVTQLKENIIKKTNKEIKPLKQNENPVKIIYKTKMSNKALEKLKTKYENFMGNDYTVNLEPLKGFKKLKDGKKVYLEEIKIVIHSKKKGRSSFIALVNTESGRIYKTWGQVRKEGLLHKHTKTTLLAPSGHL